MIHQREFTLEFGGPASGILPVVWGGACIISVAAARLMHGVAWCLFEVASRLHDDVVKVYLSGAFVGVDGR